MPDRFSFRLVLVATLLALVVVTLGAFTRLKDAGLGCPDWPGCYGHYAVPKTTAQLQSAMSAFPDQPVEADKAWAEMTHRYVAGSLGLIIVVLAIRAYRRRQLPGQPLVVPLILVGLVIFQALLGKWTVTLRLLPVVVMSHLLGGMILLSLLGLLTLQHTRFAKNFNGAQVSRLWPWAALALVIVVLQIALGGWTSANYAALACHDFPTCKGMLMPPLNFKEAYNLFMHIGPNYQGGVLDNAARVTIHFMHRLGALITFSVVGLLSLWLMFAKTNRVLRTFGSLIFITLIMQVSLGILNVVLQLPLHVAVTHNGVAAILLLLVVNLNYLLHTNQNGVLHD